MAKFFKNNRWIGSRDRREIAEFSYSIFRSFERLKFLASNIRPLSKPSNFEEFSGVIGAQNRSVLEVREDSSTGTAQKLPKGRWLRKRAITHDLGRIYVLIALKVMNGLSEAKICELFSGRSEGLSKLTDSEKKLLNRIDETTDFPEHVLLNYPEWMTALLKEAFPPETLREEMLTLSEKAQTDLRINTLKSSKDEVKKILVDSGISAVDCRYSVNGLRLQEGRISRSHRVIAEGLAEIQDEGSQLVAELCDAAPGDTVVDFCAGAGGKTLAIAASMKNKGLIFALDKYEKRLENAKIRFRRANVNNVFCQQITAKWIKRHLECADIVLVDAPCSGTGTWRRNPDMRAKFTREDLQELTATQTEILESAQVLVKNGGRLVYATCSILKEENEYQIENFLNNHREFVQKRIGNPPGNYLKLTPFQHKTDGFFVAILEKVAQPLGDSRLDPQY
jgi:16S rRNA (cytosine967-C5)-methyltransferase